MVNELEIGQATSIEALIYETAIVVVGIF